MFSLRKWFCLGLPELLQERVARGDSFLNSLDPNYERKIPLTFDVGMQNNCIISHFTGRLYREGLGVLNIHYPAKYGFDAAYCRWEYAPLNVYWRKTIKDRIRAKECAEAAAAVAQLEAKNQSLLEERASAEKTEVVDEELVGV
jgi:hypothetical protein